MERMGWDALNISGDAEIVKLATFPRTSPILKDLRDWEESPEKRNTRCLGAAVPSSQTHP